MRIIMALDDIDHIFDEKILYDSYMLGQSGL